MKQSTETSAHVRDNHAYRSTHSNTQVLDVVLPPRAPVSVDEMKCFHCNSNNPGEIAKSNCFPGPAGLCALHLDHVDTSSASVSWDSAFGEFDFHKVTVANMSVTNTLTAPKEERVVMVTGLSDGCRYNVSVERVRGVTAGSAAVLSITTGTYIYIYITKAALIKHLFIKL